MPIAIKLAEKLAPKKIQLVRAGEWKIYRGGPGFKITKEHINQMVKNFQEGARRYDDKKLPIDYFHNSDEKAAGWITNIEAIDGGLELWGDVEWTPNAAKMLEEGEVRYVSIDFDSNYKDDETGKKHGVVLLGAGLTNRPFVKNMQALTADDIENKNPNGGNMDELQKAQARIKELEGAVEDSNKKIGALTKELSDLNEAKAADEKKLAEEKKTSEKKGKFDVMLAEGKVVEGQREAFMSDDMVKFSENAKPLNREGKGKEGEGSGNTGSEKLASDEVLEKAKKLSEEKKLPMHKAIGSVLAEDKALAKRYEEEIEIK